jgi:hypothetical protein
MYDAGPSEVFVYALKLALALKVVKLASRKVANWEMNESKMCMLVPFTVGQNRSGKTIRLG